MYYVYQFLNSNDEVIYVGRTNDIIKRIRQQHFTSNGHLPTYCYDETCMILYSECVSLDDSKIKERYLINKISPKYNQKMNNCSNFNFEITDFNWIYMPTLSNTIEEAELYLVTETERELIESNKNSKYKAVCSIPPNNKFSKNNNAINNCSYNLTMNRLKMVNYILYKVYKLNSNVVTINVDDFRIIGGESPQTIKALKDDIMAIKNTDFKFQDVNKRFILDLKYDKFLRNFIITIDESFQPVKGNNSILDIHAILKFKSLYSIRLYELLKSYKSSNSYDVKFYKKVRISVQDLKDIVNLNSRSYDNFSNINLKILKPSLVDINDNSDLKFSYELIRCGKRVSDIEFTFL